MRSLRGRTIAVALGLLWAMAGTPALAQDEDPWGYLYSFRTLRLFELTGEELRIGRLPGNDVVLTSPRVSRRHAAIRQTGEGPEFLDVGSSNGSRLNGEELRPQDARPLRPGDRLQLADELLLYHDSLPALWKKELELRLLTAIVKLRLHLPQDETRRSFGREEIVPAVTEAKVDLESARVGVEHSVDVPLGGGFPEESGAFVGNVTVDDAVLELSLWALAGSDSMTSRRASYSNLKHATLRVSMAGNDSEGVSAEPNEGPWFPPQVLGVLFDVFPDDREHSLRFAHALAEQERPVALRDAAESFAFRHELGQDEGDLLVNAAKLKGLAVDGEIDARGMGLKASDKRRLSEALASARSWLERAAELGVDDDERDAAAAAIRRAEERLARLD